MDGQELKISKIAAINPGPYNRCFVYIETAAMPPIGIYEHSAASIKQVEQRTSFFPYHWEEFGIVDGRHFVTREQLDDGAAEIEGKLQDIRGRNELRSRYVTPYNFVIAPRGSPIDSMNFDERIDEAMNAMLHGEDQLEALMNAVLRAPLPTR